MALLISMYSGTRTIVLQMIIGREKIVRQVLSLFIHFELDVKNLRGNEKDLSVYRAVVCTDVSKFL